MRCALKLTGCLALCGMTGCAAGVSLSAAPSVDTKGQFGTEERIQAFSAVGDRRLRFFVSVGGGVGYLGTPKSGEATFQPEMGVEGGDEVQWGAAAFYAPRFLFSGPVEVAQGGGSSGQVLFRMKGMGGEHGSLLVGPRLSTELLDLDPSLPNGRGVEGLVSLSLVVKLVLFDTTGNSWTSWVDRARFAGR